MSCRPLVRRHAEGGPWQELSLSATPPTQHHPQDGTPGEAASCVSPRQVKHQDKFPSGSRSLTDPHHSPAGQVRCDSLALPRWLIIISFHHCALLYTLLLLLLYHVCFQCYLLFPLLHFPLQCGLYSFFCVVLSLCVFSVSLVRGKAGHCKPRPPSSSFRGGSRHTDHHHCRGLALSGGALHSAEM